MRCVVDVDRGAVGPVVPVMKARCDEEADVRVDEAAVEVNNQQVGLNRLWLEAKRKHRQRRQAAKHSDFGQVHAGTCKPVHLFRRVVNGVKAPMMMMTCNQNGSSTM